MKKSILYLLLITTISAKITPEQELAVYYIDQKRRYIEHVYSTKETSICAATSTGISTGFQYSAAGQSRSSNCSKKRRVDGLDIFFDFLEYPKSCFKNLNIFCPLGLFRNGIYTSRIVKIYL